MLIASKYRMHLLCLVRYYFYMYILTFNNIYIFKFFKTSITFLPYNHSLIVVQLKMKGVTGNIEFTSVGLRKNYQLQILDVGFQTVHSKIADWSDQTGLVFEEGSENGVSIANGPTPGIMRVTTVLVR